jgi:hypothetical protein
MSLVEQLEAWRERWVAANEEKRRCSNAFQEAFERFLAHGTPPSREALVKERQSLESKWNEAACEIDRLLEQYVRLTGRHARICVHGWEWPCEDCIDSGAAQEVPS